MGTYLRVHLRCTYPLMLLLIRLPQVPMQTAARLPAHAKPSFITLLVRGPLQIHGELISLALRSTTELDLLSPPVLEGFRGEGCVLLLLHSPFSALPPSHPSLSALAVVIHT